MRLKEQARSQGKINALSPELLPRNSHPELRTGTPRHSDHLMPTAREVPPIDVIVTEDAPSPLNPMGLKGGGEGRGNVGV